MLARLRQSEFVANEAKLFAGNGVVFAISLFAIPVISRLYTSGDFGVIGLFVPIVAVAAVFATLKYEMALVLPEILVRVGFYNTGSLMPEPEKLMASRPWRSG